ncbi:MAG: regulatory protein RecX [Mycobacterium leprae]
MKRTSRSNPAGAGEDGPRTRTPRVDVDELAAVSGTLTAMEPQRKEPKRRSIYVDGRFVLGLHEESIILAGLKTGKPVDGARLVVAYRLDQEKRAWDEALFLLSITARARREVERKLTSRYSPEVAESVLARLDRGGWLDDREFARSYVRSKPAFGPQRLQQDLIRKGVDRQVAQAAIAELRDESDSFGAAREAAAARLSRMGEVDRTTAERRLASFLARRGYGFETISAVLGPLLADLPRPERKPPKQGSSLRSGNSLRKARPTGEGEQEGEAARTSSSLRRRSGLGWGRGRPDSAETE